MILIFMFQFIHLVSSLLGNLLRRHICVYKKLLNNAIGLHTYLYISYFVFKTVVVVLIVTLNEALGLWLRALLAGE